MQIDPELALDALTRLVRDHLAHERAEPVRAPLEPEVLRARIDLSLESEGRDFAEVEALLAEILAVTPTTASTSFFNQLFAGRDGAALLGDVLASLLNNSMYTYKVAGVHVLIELLLVSRMGRMVGFVDPEGVFTPGGSLSNLCALVVARNQAVPGLREHGADGRTLRMYTSADSHYSVRKAAGLLGLGRANCVDIPVDAAGRMLPAALERAIVADLAEGFVPVMINATAGTTVHGAFDPLEPIADIAERHGVWLHVDAAYGGSMRFHPEFDPHFAGIERADSVTWDAHKMLGVPLTSSVVLVRQKGLLTKHFNEVATYLFQDDGDDLNPGTRSIQCGRRNDALKLWTAWKTHGDRGFTERVTHLRANTLHARDRVLAHPELTLVREPASLNLCFTVAGVDADVLCTELNRQGRAMVGHALVDGQVVVRVVFLNASATPEHIDAFFAHVLETAAVLR